jgi:hypothetical protein
MEGVYSKTLKQAYRLTKGHKIFWRLGLFLVWLNLFRSFLIIVDSSFFFNLPGVEEYSKIGKTQSPGNPWLAGVSLIVLAILVIYYFRSKAILIKSVKQLRSFRQVDANLVVEESEPHTINLLKVGFGLFALMLVLTGVLLSPIMYLNANDYSSRAIVLGIFATIIYVPLFLVLYYASIFIPMLMVVNNLPAWDSFRVSVDLVKKHWPTLIVFSIILLGVELIGLLVSVVLMGIVVIPFVLLMQISYDVGGFPWPVLWQALGGIAVIVVFFITQAMVAAYQRVAWNVAFFEMIRPIKEAEQPAPATVPEII